MTSRLVPHGLGGHARTCALLLRPVIEQSILVSATLEAVPRGMDGPKEPPAPTGARFWAQVGVINLSSFLMGMALVQLNTVTGDPSARGALVADPALVVAAQAALYLSLIHI